MMAIESASSISSDRSWVMKSDGEAEPLAQLHQLLEDLPLGDHVQGGGRLVHDHDLRVQRQRHRDHHALPHPAGQLVRIAAEPVGGDADHAQQFARPAPGGRLGPCCRLVRLEHVGELRVDRDHRVERVHRALEHHGDLRPAELPELRRSSAASRSTVCPSVAVVADARRR